MEAVGKSVLDLNDEERFRSWMSREEDMIVMANTEKALAYEEGEAKGQKEIARNLLKENMNISFISKVTGLSEQEIHDLSI